MTQAAAITMVCEQEADIGREISEDAVRAAFRKYGRPTYMALKGK